MDGVDQPTRIVELLRYVLLHLFLAFRPGALEQVLVGGVDAQARQGAIRQAHHPLVADLLHDQIRCHVGDFRVDGEQVGVVADADGARVRLERLDELEHLLELVVADAQRPGDAAESALGQILHEVADHRERQIAARIIHQS